MGFWALQGVQNWIWGFAGISEWDFGFCRDSIMGFWALYGLDNGIWGFAVYVWTFVCCEHNRSQVLRFGVIVSDPRPNSCENGNIIGFALGVWVWVGYDPQLC